MVLSRGLAPRTSAFAERRAQTAYTLRAYKSDERMFTPYESPITFHEMASVAGLAPARPGLKDRLLELLCIHGRKSGIMELGVMECWLSNTPRLLLCSVTPSCF